MIHLHIFPEYSISTGKNSQFRGGCKQNEFIQPLGFYSWTTSSLSKCGYSPGHQENRMNHENQKNLINI